MNRDIPCGAVVNKIDPSSEIRVFNTLDAWRIQKVEAIQPTDMPSPEPIAPADSEDDLPF